MNHPADYFEAGYFFTKGCCKYLWKAILKFLLILIVVMFVFNLVFNPTDNSDKSRFERSNMKLHTDYKTGLQYFSSRGGGLYPRLDKNGNHMKYTE